MLYNTRGIVFRTVKYSDHSIIAKIYTELFGLQGFLINTGRNKKSTVKKNTLQPMSLVDLVIYHKEKKQLHRIQEVNVDYPFERIPYDVIKSSIVLFINEILYKSIREEEQNKPLFDFIYNSLKRLDSESGVYVNFHLIFMAQLTKFLGFYPQGNFSETTPFFDLKEGQFQNSKPNHFNFILGKESELFYRLFTKGVEVNMNNTQRKQQLFYLIQYYKLHMEIIGELESPKVLEEIFSE